MKIVLSESQYQRLIETKEEQKILRFPSLDFFDKDPVIAWNIIQKIVGRKGNPPYSIEGNLDLRDIPIESLGKLTSVGGDLDLQYTPIKSLGNLTSVGGSLDLLGTPIKSLGNLQSVGGYLDLQNTPIESLGNLQSVGGDLVLNNTPIESLGNLTSVGGDLVLRQTQLYMNYTGKKIRQMIKVGGYIYL